MIFVCPHFTHIVCRNVSISCVDCGPMSGGMAEPALLYPLPAAGPAPWLTYTVEGGGARNTEFRQLCQSRGSLHLGYTLFHMKVLANLH